MEKYEFQPNLARASTLPASWYTSSETWDVEQRELWPHSWQLVSRKEALSEAGSFVTCKVGRENLLLTNDGQKIRAFSNVCRHRAGPVASGCGKAANFKCKYHNWIYSMEGKLLGTPEFNGVENFEREKVQLPEWKVATWGPLVFVSSNPRMSFDEYLGQIPEEVAYVDPDTMKYFFTKDYPVHCNWKAYVDNYLEGYHLSAVHPTLSRELDYSQYRVDTFRWYSSQQAPARSTAQLYAGGDHPGAHYFWLFPNLMLNIYQGMVQTNVVIPVSKDQCIVRFEWYLKGEQFEKVKEKMPGLIEFSDQIQEEDRWICEKVQENLQSKDYHQGRFSVKRENGVHHFHGLMSETLGSATRPSYHEPLRP